MDARSRRIEGFAVGAAVSVEELERDPHPAEAGETAPAVDPRGDAVQAAALADGLAWHLLSAPSALAGDDAVAALDAHLDRLMPT